MKQRGDMTEAFPEHQRQTIASRARDILMHYGEPVTSEDRVDNYRVPEWEGIDTEGDGWFVTLVSDGAYYSTYYAVDLRAMTSSAHHRYNYNVAKNEFTHQSPLGVLVGTNQDQIGRNMYSWLVHRATPDAVEYDEAGVQLRAQREFTQMGARTAIHEVMRTDEGKEVFRQLLHMQDTEGSNKLYGQFYDLSRRPTMSFYVGMTALRSVLEPIVERFRPRQLQTNEATVQVDDRQSRRPPVQ